jgi:hypothetical protein
VGLYIRPWMLIDYPDVPSSVGRFEGDAFDAERWKPEYPNAAFDNMRPDDAFWAARIVSKFSDQAIRAIVEKARYTDPRATEYITATLIKRRNKVLGTWLNGVNPVVNASIDRAGTLTFENAAVAANVATPAASYTIQWFRFDNAADAKQTIGDAVEATEGTAPAPPALLTSGEYIGVTITAGHAEHPDWARPATFYFRRTRDGWECVASER